MRESPVQQRVRLTAAQLGCDLWRNNSGAFQDETGRWVRYGLANDSKQLNAEIKSSDLIGGTPELVYVHRLQEWRTVSILTAIECKPSNWTLRPGDERGLAQQRFIDIVRAAGGYAGFATSVEDFKRIIGR